MDRRQPRASPRLTLSPRSLLAVAGLSLAGLLGLRLYAAAFTVRIATPWDDAATRQEARTEAKTEGVSLALAHLLLPRAPPVLEGRLNGYQRWLVLGKGVGKLVAPGHEELSFQLTNVLLLCLQGIVVLLFAHWALRDVSLAAALTFVTLSAPVVFGLNRWILGENLVLTAGLVLPFLAALLLGREGGSGARHVVLAGAVAYGMGLFSSAREYAAPSLFVIAGATVVGLVARARLREAAAFVSVLACFLVPLARPLASALRITLAKGAHGEYYHSFGEWIPHVFVYTVGPALSLTLAVLGGVVGTYAIRAAPAPGEGEGRRSRLRREVSGLRALLWAHVLLLAFYAAGIVWTQNRISRPAIPLMLVALGFVLIGTRLFPPIQDALRAPRARRTALILVAGAWSVLACQLFFAFDGGRTYAHAAYRLEYYNHPLSLPRRPLPDDYVCYDSCPYDGGWVPTTRRP